eukprot:12588997-Alexandrium_andersonii.AAC.1
MRYHSGANPLPSWADCVTCLGPGGPHSKRRSAIVATFSFRPPHMGPGGSRDFRRVAPTSTAL